MRAYILEKITKLRKEKGLSIFKLTELADLSPNTIYKWYRTEQKTYSTIEALGAVCDVLGITLANLFTKDSQEKRTVETEEMLSIYSDLTSEQQYVCKQVMKQIRNASLEYIEKEGKS